MVLGVLVALLAATTVLVLALRVAVDGTPSAWGYRELGWPSGVQEDDDLHWSWTPAAPATRVSDRSRARVVTRTAEPADAIDRPPALEVGLTPLRYEVRSPARDRS